MHSPIRSILAATDLGEGSDAIVRSAAIIAERTGAELHLLHSLELPWVPADDVMRRSGFFGQIESAQERLQQQVERTMPDGVRPASQNVIIYVARKAILDRAKEVSADLIVVGPHRGGAASASFLGTTADRVIRTAEVPCLIIEEPLSANIRRIGVPLDFSDPSRVALAKALEWAPQLGGGAGPSTTLQVMHVVTPVDFEGAQQTDDSIRAELEREVREATSRVGRADVEVSYEILRATSPADETVAWAARSDIDLLIMGTHGRGGLRRALIGSVAGSVARLTPKPVLLVPPHHEGHDA